MPILVRARSGESKEAAEERARNSYPGQRTMIERTKERAGGAFPSGSGIIGKLINEYNIDKARVMLAISEIRRPWSEKVKIAIKQCEISRNTCNEMKSSGGLSRYLNPAHLMAGCENKLGSAFVLSKKKIWTIEKYYNIVSNLEMGEWTRGATAGITYSDEVSFGGCLDRTKVIVEKSEFCEIRRLGIAAGEVLGQDMPEADRLAKAMKFPKLREGLTPSQRGSASAILKQANMGQNHLTRLVRGVLLAMGAEMSGVKLKMRANLNSMKWCDYTPETVDCVFKERKTCAIWCGYPMQDKYASMLPHLTQGWNCSGLPLRIKNIEIPSDGEMTYVISLGQGVLEDVEMDADDIRSAVNTYAQSMGCEDVLERAYCIGSMLLLHENIPAVHLPASLWSSDLIRPAMCTKHEISRHKREWNLREAMILSKYVSDVIGLMVKELMSSGWDHNSEEASDAIARVSSGHVGQRNEFYRWIVENITGVDTGFIFNIDPLSRADMGRINKINDTSILKYWYLQEVKTVGGDSLCGALMCSNYTAIPSSGKDTSSARELGFLRQIGVLEKGPMYKREVRMKNIVVSEEKKDMIEGTLKEGRVSVVNGGLSMSKNRERKQMVFNDWDTEAEKIDVKKYDDDSEDETGGISESGEDEDDGDDDVEDEEEEEMEDEAERIEREKMEEEKKKVDEREKKKREEEEEREEERKIEKERARLVRELEISKKKMADELERRELENKEKEAELREKLEKDMILKKKQSDEEKRKKKEEESIGMRTPEGGEEKSATVEQESGESWLEKAKRRKKEEEEKKKKNMEESAAKYVVLEKVRVSSVETETERQKRRRHQERAKREEAEKKMEGESDRQKKYEELFAQTEVVEEVEAVKSGPVVREGKEDLDFLEAIFDDNETAKKSKYWQELKAVWVKESKFMLEHWRRRNISEGVIEECCNLMKDIFPSTSLHLGGDSKPRVKMVTYAGSLIGIVSMGSDEPGEWDRNHFLVQMWSWRNNKKWLDVKLAGKASDVAKELANWRKDLKTVDINRWDEWSKRKFGSEPDALGIPERARVDQGIRSGNGRNIVQGICGLVKLEMPDWAMKSDLVVNRNMFDRLNLYWEKKTPKKLGVGKISPS